MIGWDGVEKREAGKFFFYRTELGKLMVWRSCEERSIVAIEWILIPYGS